MDLSRREMIRTLAVTGVAALIPANVLASLEVRAPKMPVMKGFLVLPYQMGTLIWGTALPNEHVSFPVTLGHDNQTKLFVRPVEGNTPSRTANYGRTGFVLRAPEACDYMLCSTGTVDLVGGVPGWTEVQLTFANLPEEPQPRRRRTLVEVLKGVPQFG